MKPFDKDRIPEAVQAAIHESGPLDVFLLNLRIWQNMTPKEIASVTGLRKQEVANRLKVVYERIQQHAAPER